MAILITADIQADFHNLDLCRQMWDEVLSICTKEKIKYIAVLGDLKQAMNPVDVRIITWWQKAIRKAVKLGLEVIILLGNHDRVGAYSNADNWLEILKRAGAHTFDKPGTFVADEIELYLLPYENEANTRHNARQCKEMLSNSANKHATTVLCFHQDITGAKYNQQGSKSDVKLNCSDLFSDDYNYTVGGHVHLPQIIKTKKRNTYYVGSPFCHDWGEVNQIKRYLIIHKERIRSISSSIPRRYDPDVSGFSESKPASWVNAKIRIQVSCDDSQDYGRRLEKARRRAEQKYPGADIYVVPKFKESSNSELHSIQSADSDERKIREYIRQTRSDAGTRCLEYMVNILSQYEGGLRTTSKIKFKRLIGKNFLSFKNLDIDLSHKGITLIQGVNEDRNSKSNGSGKTSYAQILPVALFGRTFKDQKANAWTNRWVKKERSYARIYLDSEGRKIYISRERNPVKLRMSVDGKAVESGMRTTAKDGTQQQIENRTGFTWQTLANAVYIDRVVADSFLSGSNKQRTEVLSRFQNLERFECALEQVKKDIGTLNEKESSVREKLFECRGAIKHTIEAIKDLKIVGDNQIQDLKTRYAVAKKRLQDYRDKTCKKYQELVLKCGYMQKSHDIVLKKVDNWKHVIYKEEMRYSDKKNEIHKVNYLERKKECPTCYQPVSKKWIKLYKTGIDAQLRAIAKSLSRYKKEFSIVHKNSQYLIVDKDKYEESISKIKNKERELELESKQLRRQYEELQAKQQDHPPVSKAKHRLKKLKSRKQRLKSKLHRYSKKRKIYNYSQEAFSRDGIPAFLNRQLCPVLNKAAEYYAELFSDKEIQIRFEVIEGEFIPRVINMKGGENIDDQSTGERALAGLIASFALREVAPACNLLVLDEPGEGLDSQTAKQFARALTVLVKRFKSIFVCTHNVHILSELEGERIVTIRKKNKISTVEAV